MTKIIFKPTNISDFIPLILATFLISLLVLDDINQTFLSHPHDFCFTSNVVNVLILAIINISSLQVMVSPKKPNVFLAFTKESRILLKKLFIKNHLCYPYYIPYHLISKIFVFEAFSFSYNLFTKRPEIDF